MVTEELVSALEDFQKHASSDYEVLKEALNCWSRVEKVAGLEWAEYLDAAYEVELALEDYNEDYNEAIMYAEAMGGFLSRPDKSQIETAVQKRNETKKAFEEAASSELNTAHEIFRSAEVYLASVKRSLVSRKEWGNVRQIVSGHGRSGLPPRWIAEMFPFFWMRTVDDWMKTNFGDDHPLHGSVLSALRQQEDGRGDLDSPAADEERLQDQTMKDMLVEEFGLVCWGCGFEPPDARYLQLDHVSPKSEGGAHEIDNRALLCGPCNRKKSDKMSLSELQRVNKREKHIQNIANLPDLKEARAWTRERLKKNARNDEPEEDLSDLPF